MRRSLSHIPSLDGLRAFSFLLVFVGHAGLDRYVPGGFGVTVFFFLSGFLITTLMRAEHEQYGRISFRDFWLRRALRILPPFYLVLIAATLASVLLEPRGTVLPSGVASRALHATNYWIIYRGYDGEPAGTGVYWSLAVEEHFYLAFPWLYAGLQRLELSNRAQAFTFWGLCLVVLAWRTVLELHFHVPSDRTYMATDTRIDSILYGCALAVWRNPVLDEPRADERIWKWLLVPCALGVLGASFLVHGDAFRETARYSLQGAALTFVFVAAIRFHDTPAFRMLNWRPIAFLGVLSYSLYLLHYAVLFVVGQEFPASPGLVRAALALVLSVGLALLLYFAVERPCARLRRKLSAVLAAAPAPPAYRSLPDGTSPTVRTGAPGSCSVTEIPNSVIE